MPTGAKYKCEENTAFWLLTVMRIYSLWDFLSRQFLSIVLSSENHKNRFLCKFLPKSWKNKLPFISKNSDKPAPALHERNVFCKHCSQYNVLARQSSKGMSTLGNVQNTFRFLLLILTN